MYTSFYSLKHLVDNHITFILICYLFLLDLFQVLLAAEPLRVSHTIIHWSFESLDVVVENT